MMCSNLVLFSYHNVDVSKATVSVLQQRKYHTFGIVVSKRRSSNRCVRKCNSEFKKRLAISHFVYFTLFHMLSTLHYFICCLLYIISYVVYFTLFHMLFTLHYFICCLLYIISYVVYFTLFHMLFTLHYFICCLLFANSNTGRLK